MFVFSGLITAIECFRERDKIAARNDSRCEESCLHDLTMAYEDYVFGQRPSEMSLFSGRLSFFYLLFIFVTND